MNEERFIDLESRIAHQEMTIEKLKQAIFDQNLTIAKLEKNIKQLTDRFEGGTEAPEIGPANEKPPHY